jgi:thiamine-phosphate diphosphorylase
LSDPRLARLAGVYPLADDDPRWKRTPRELIELTLAAGPSVLQLRLKHTSDAEALELARWAAEACRAVGALFIVNDRIDLADLAGADGVHLGEADLAPERIPAEVRARLLVGLSTHTLDAVHASRERPVDYIGFGPVFGTRSKDSPYSARGLEQLGAAVAASAHPVVAIGGITAGNIGDVSRSGAAAAAVISAIAGAPDPGAATGALQAEFVKAR